MPSSSARRRNAPNLIRPLHRVHGFGVRPASCSATKSPMTSASNSSERLQISKGHPPMRAIEAAEGAAARGLWVAGYLSFDAAPGLDDALSVRPRRAGDPFARLPLAWFGLFDRREVSALPRPRDDGPPPDGAWEPSVDRAR